MVLSYFTAVENKLEALTETLSNAIRRTLCYLSFNAGLLSNKSVETSELSRCTCKSDAALKNIGGKLTGKVLKTFDDKLGKLCKTGCYD